eukprot:758336-Hanusia_phi.AAC.1
MVREIERGTVLGIGRKCYDGHQVQTGIRRIRRWRREEGKLGSENGSVEKLNAGFGGSRNSSVSAGRSGGGNVEVLETRRLLFDFLQEESREMEKECT